MSSSHWRIAVSAALVLFLRATPSSNDAAIALAQASGQAVVREFTILRLVSRSDDKVQLAIIVVDAEATARSILARLKAGEPFAQLATELSLHPTRMRGGDLGEMVLADLREEFRAALNGLPIGGWALISGPPRAVPGTATSADADSALGIALANAGRFDEAVIALTAAIGKAPSLELYTMRGQAYLEARKFQMAIDDFRRALTLYGDNHFLHFAIGEAQGNLREFGDALKSFDAAIRLKRTPEYLVARGKANYGLRRLDAARDDFADALSFSIDALPASRLIRAEVFNGLGLLAYEDGDYKGAIVILNGAIEAKSDYAPAYRSRSRARRAIGDTAGAAADSDAADRLERVTQR
jgi:tetratricopeptide (TPR) repeat protein